MQGIDYGHGQTNIDHATGIRYGVISQGALASWFYDEWMADYGDPACPKCGAPAKDVTGYGAKYLNLCDEYEQYDDRGCTDYACDACRITFDSGDAFPEEPRGYELIDDEYHAVDCLDLRSPYYTRGVFCSPCVPGAVSLESPDVDGERAYCFGHEFFEDGRAPYPVYRVADDQLVEPEKGGS